VLWHPRGGPIQQELLGALDKRGLARALCDNEYQVLATLCREESSLRGSNGQRVPTVLMLVNPRRLAALSEVLDLVTQYRPGTATWVFDEAQPRRIRSMAALEVIAEFTGSVGSGDLASPFTARPGDFDFRSSFGVSDADSPRLRLAGDGELPGVEEELARGTSERVSDVRARADSKPAKESGDDLLSRVSVAPRLVSRLVTDEELAILMSRQ
jgi:hypothetical protein